MTAIGEVRGLGAMIAVEFRQGDGSPNPEFTRQGAGHALEKACCCSLRRAWQYHSLPVPPDHPGRRDGRGPGHPGSRAAAVTARRQVSRHPVSRHRIQSK
ncbi:hypothetical protein ACU4GD_00140 [Cupriavidus basilensis]